MEWIGDFGFLGSLFDFGKDLEKEQGSEIRMIDYDLEDRNSIVCVRNGVVNLEAFSNRV